MHIFIHPCVKLIADLLQNRPETEGEWQLIYHMYTAITHLLAAHLSHCIPVMEEHGETLLQYARNLFPSLTATHRDAMVDYFSVHLSICEEAGRLQGLSIGELGRVGPATLDDTQLNYLISLIASEKALAKLPSNVLSKTKQQHQQSSSSSSSKYDLSSPYLIPLSRRHRRYLELCARLLRYTQSNAILTAKLERVEDVANLLVGTVEKRSLSFPLPVESQCSKVANILSNIETPSLCVTCPWAKIISNRIQASIHPYRDGVYVSGETPKSQGKRVEKIFQSKPRRSTTTAQSPSISVEASSSLMGTALLIPCLQCICACAEAFPLGECWSTNIGIRQPSVYFNSQEVHTLRVGRSCSTKDLAVVVNLVNQVLVSHGNVEGDAGVQVWALLSLIKLSESSLLAQAGSVTDIAGATELSDAWKLAWSNLMRQDLRYVSFTRDTKINSAGELVLRLFQHMVENYCTSNPIHSQSEDSQGVLWPEPCRFLHYNQHQLWCLPVLEDPTALNSAAIFELIITFQSIIGISEDGQDIIDGKFTSFTSPADIDMTQLNHSQAERRFRLVCFCLRFIEESISNKCEQVQKPHLAIASLCLASLLCGTSLSTLRKSGPKSIDRCTCTADEYDFTIMTPEEQSEASSTLLALWSGFLDSSCYEHMFYDSAHSWRNSHGFGPRLSLSQSRDSRRLAESVRSRQQISMHPSFSSQKQILDFSLQFLRRLLSSLSDQGDMIEDENKTDGDLFSLLSSRFRSRAFGLMTLIGTSISLIPVSLAETELAKQDEALLLQFLDDFISFMPPLSINSDLFCDVSACILGILRMLALASESSNFNLSMALNVPLASLLEACQDLLYSYGMRFGSSDSKLTTSPLPRRRKDFKDDFSDSSGSDSDRGEFEFLTQGRETSLDVSSPENDMQPVDRRKKKKVKQSNPASLQLSGGIKTSKAHALNIPETAVLDSRGFRIVAGILAILEPSSHCCRIVADSLLGLSLDDARGRDAMAFDVDPGDIIFICHLFFNEKSILREKRLKSLSSRECTKSKSLARNQKESMSVVGTCLTLISLARSLLIYDFFGFSWGSKIVSTLRAKEDEGEEDEEVDMILDLLNPLGSDVIPKEVMKWTRKSIKTRSYIRKSQLSAVSEAFVHGSSKFHQSFDSVYASDFVLASLSDISDYVRRNASQAVGTALIFYPNQRTIVDAIIHSIPYFLLDRNTEKINHKFTRWVSEKIGNSTDSASLEKRSWEDTRVSFQSSAIETLGIIIGRTSDVSIAREHTFSLITLSCHRPQLQLACFFALQHAARLKGHFSVSDFLKESLEWLLLKWIAEKRDLSTVPLLMCDPDLLETLLFLGVAGGLMSSDGPLMELPMLDLAVLHRRALRKFASSNSSYMIPIILISKLDCDTTEPEDDTDDHRQKYLLEMMALMSGNDAGISLDEFLRCHLHCIYAQLYPMVNADNCEYDVAIRETGQETIQYLHSSLSWNEMNPQLARRLVLRILQLWGRKPAIYGLNCDLPLNDVSYMNAIKFVASRLRKSVSNATLFEEAGSSVTECILNVKILIDSCVVSLQKEQMLSVMSSIFDSVSEHLTVSSAKNLQIDFCIHILLSLISDKSLLNFRLFILKTLRRFVENLLQVDIFKKLAPLISEELSRIVVYLFHLHSEARSEFFGFCATQQDKKRLKVEKSFGLLEKLEPDQHVSSIDGLKPFMNSLTKSAHELIEIMENVYDFLSFILLDSHPSVENVLNLIYPLPTTDDVSQMDSMLFLESNVLNLIYPLPTTDDVSQMDRMLFLENKRLSVRGILDRFQERLGQRVTNLELEDEIHRFIQFVEIGSKSATNVQHNTGLFEAALNRLWTVLKHRRERLVSSKGSSPAFINDLQVMLSLLLSLCTKDVPEKVRFSASRCLGELGGEDFSMFPSTFLTKPNSIISLVGNEDNEDPLLFFKIDAVERLHYLLMSGCTETSLVAMETMRALFSMKTGDSYWMMLKSDKTRVSLNALRLCTKDQTIIVTTPEYFVRKMFSKVGTCEKAMMQKDWCWNENIWKCNSSYEEWIKDLVCSILICCYDTPSYHNKPVRESSIFFSLCTGICAREHTFAEFIFPAIIYDLLLHGEAPEGGSAEIVSLGVREQVLAETMVGPSNSSVNKILTQCFCQNLPGAQSSSHHKAVSLFIDTLLFLLQVMKSRFLSSDKHSRNPVSLSNRGHQNLPSTTGRKSSASNLPLKDDSNYNSGIDPPPIWKGLPYGVVLHLEGIDVAIACQKVKRFTCGLLFADIFADNMLGGSGGVLERLSAHVLGYQINIKSHKKFDISGYGEEFREHGGSPKRVHDEQCIALFHNTLKCCLSELDEQDAVLGVNAHATTLEIRSDFFGSGRNSCVFNMLSLSSKLKAQNMTSLGQEDDSLRFNFISHSEKRKLKEKMSQNSWRMLLWDDFVCPDNVGMCHSVVNHEDKMAPDEDKAFSYTLPGFHESIKEALGCLSSGNVSACKSRLKSARLSLLHEIDAAVGSDSIFRLIGPVVSKFQILNDFELLSDDSQGRPFPEKLLSRWGLIGGNIRTTYSNFSEMELVYSIREAAIRIVCRQLPTYEQPRNDLLILHLHRFCTLARELSHIESSQQAVERLSKVVVKQDIIKGLIPSQFSLSLMEVRLQEAKNLYACCDFAGAIRTAKVVVTRLQGEKTTGSNIDSVKIDRVLCDSLLQLGIWISSHYRIESAKSILENYYCKAAKLADSLYARSKNPTDSERAMKTHLSMAEFVVGIYDSVVTRVKSYEWKLASAVAQQRQLELEKTRELYNEARRIYSEITNRNTGKKGKKAPQSSASKSTADIQEAEAVCHDLFLHLKVLEKEVEGDNKERLAVEESVSRLLLSAVESYETGLSLNSNSTADPKDGSLKHVFRLVSLWFGNESNNDVNAVIRRIAKKVPSHLFVPLTYQIFSRLESISGTSKSSEASQNESTFQSALRSIVYNTCVEHPYHSLVQLIALANGNKVGNGVGGRQSIAYLENVGASKVEACNELLQSIQRSAPPYVVSLVDSYSALIDSYIELAMAPTEELIKDAKHRTKEIPFSAISSGSRGSPPTLDRCLGSAKRKAYACQPCVLTKPPYIRPGKSGKTHKSLLFAAVSF
jgi:hypothetical protein